jgi:hypothetical protein
MGDPAILKNRHRLGLGKFDESSLAAHRSHEFVRRVIADTLSGLRRDDGADAEIVKTVPVLLPHGMMDFLS